MTPEAQRIAIAEACGWHSMDYKSVLGIMGMKGPMRGFMLVPDYLNDLNAMHEAEKVLTFEQYHHEYIPRLEKVSTRDKCSMYSTTAAQRAEAFLRTIGKWQDSTEQKAHKCTQ
jgi:hypothetical protein